MKQFGRSLLNPTPALLRAFASGTAPARPTRGPAHPGAQPPSGGDARDDGVPASSPDAPSRTPKAMAPAGTRTLRSLALAAALSALAATATRAGAAPNVGPLDFHDYDSNGDGRVSAAEFHAQGGHEQAFSEGDANGDGHLDRDEFVKTKAANDRLKAGKLVNDAWITAKIKTLLLTDEAVKGLDVTVQTHKGMVLLSGWVDDAHQIPRAEQIARGVEGVKGVGNDLRVKP